MIFSIPKTRELNNEVLTERFYKRYYPEMATKNVWTIWGTFTRLQKNPFVCAHLKVDQKPHHTEIVRFKGVTRRVAIAFLHIINLFIRGDFYKEFDNNLRKFLQEEYGYSDEDIVKVPSWWSRNRKKIVKFVVMPMIVLFSSFGLLALYDQEAYELGKIDLYYTRAGGISEEESVLDYVEIPNEDKENEEENEYEDKPTTRRVLRYKPTGQLLEGYEGYSEYKGYVLLKNEERERFLRTPSGEFKKLGNKSWYGSYFSKDGYAVVYDDYYYNYFDYALYNLDGEEVDSSIILKIIINFIQSIWSNLVVFFLPIIISIVVYRRNRRKEKKKIQLQSDENKTLKNL